MMKRLIALALVVVFLAPMVFADHIKIKQLRVDERVVRGEQLRVHAELNAGSAKNLKQRIIIQELPGVRTSGPFDHNKGRSKVSQNTILDIPEDIEPGEYLVRYSVHGKDGKRVKHRFVTIE